MVSSWSRSTIPLLSFVFLASCKPEDEGRPSLLEAPRVLAARTLPAEVEPGATATLEILRAGPDGRIDSEGVTIDLCLARRRIAEPGVVAAECLELAPNAGVLAPVEPAEPTSFTVPEDACSLFGPKVVTTSEFESPRPVDPDKTGGYYQPLRLVDEDSISFFPTRISCDLTRTRQETAIEYNRRYAPNENPRIRELLLGRDDGSVERLGPDSPLRVRPSESVLLAVTWPSCPTDKNECGDGLCGIAENGLVCAEDCCDPAACEREDEGAAKRACLQQCVRKLPQCEGAETYLLLDPVSKELRFERESIRVSWFVTGGTLERDKSGTASADLERETQNRWTAPRDPGAHWLFAVIRDDRGGTAWVIQPIQVEE